MRVDTSSGGYSVHFEGDALSGYYDANQAKARNDQAQRDIDQAKKDIGVLESRIKNAKAQVYLFSTGQDAEIPCENANTAGVDAYTKKVCGNRTAGLTDRGTNSGRKCGYHHFALACIDTGP